MKTKIQQIKSNVILQKENHKYILNDEEIPSVNEIIQRIYPMGEIDEKILEYGRARGLYVHAYLEDKYLNNEEPNKVKEEFGSEYQDQFDK